MMAWLFLAGLLIIGLFSFVLLFGAPFLPTLSNRKKDALELLDLKPGQVLLELGSGDGRMLIEAAKLGIKGIGYELNPLLVMYSKLISFKYRKLVTIKLANYWQIRLPECDGIYVFLLNPYMSKLHNKITQEISNRVNPVGTRPPKGGRDGSDKLLPGSDGVNVVSFAFQIPEKKHAKEINGMYLYVYNNKKPGNT